MEFYFSEMKDVVHLETGCPMVIICKGKGHLATVAKVKQEVSRETNLMLNLRSKKDAPRELT